MGGEAMNTAAFPSPALRPFLPEDAPLLAMIFRASIEELTGEDYDPAQQEAWAETGDDIEAFAARLTGMLTLVATLAGRPVGFSCLKGVDEIDMLYIHPGVARRGIASMLVDALERLAGARGAKALKVQASDTAEPLFARRGYIGQSRQTVRCGEEWLANTVMVKTFAPSPGMGEGGRA
jgi:putative acetyltransferase